MCLAIPGQIIEVKEGKKATVNFSGVKKLVDTTFLESVAEGDYVLVHVGCAIQKVDEEAAKETYRLLAEIRKEDLEAELNPDKD
jgi:hydrogenase expression/formation protein HypC